MWEDVAHCGPHHSFPRQRILNCVRGDQAEHNQSNEQALVNFLCSWLWMWLEVPSSCQMWLPHNDGCQSGVLSWINPFSPKLLFVGIFCHKSNKNRTHSKEF